MRQVRRPGNRWYVWLAGAALLACLGSPGTCPAQRNYSGLVAALQEALRAEVNSAVPQELQERRATLETRIKPIRSISGMRQALSLQEWRDEDPDPAIAKVDAPVRKELADRLANDLRQAVAHGDTSTRLAAIATVAELGVTVRAVGTRDSLASAAAPELAKLAEDEQADISVRAAAARALGRIFAKPARTAADALGRLQRSDNVVLRRAAADGLLGMIQVALQLVKLVSNTTGIVATPADVLSIGTLVVERAGVSVRDSDPETRRLGLQAIRQTTSIFTLTEVLGSAAGLGDIGTQPGLRPRVTAEQGRLLPLARALNAQAPTVADTLRDREPALRVEAAHVLEDMGWARRRLIQGAPLPTPGPVRPMPATGGRGGSGLGRGNTPRTPAARGGEFLRASYEEEQQPEALPKPAPAPGPERPALQNPAAVLLEGLDKTLPALEAALRDQNVQVRLAALTTIEALGIDAKPAVPALTRACADPDLFVRWAAVRTLGEIGPVPGVRTVPSMVPLLRDQDVDVRMAAITALDRYGPAAEDAVPALAQVVTRGDVEVRVAAIHALQDIITQAPEVVAALIGALRYPDPRVRLAAATALGDLRPNTPAVIAALTAALTDADAGVRQAASEAILDIRGNPR